jgi:hypothetical protein
MSSISSGLLVDSKIENYVHWAMRAGFDRIGNFILQVCTRCLYSFCVRLDVQFRVDLGLLDHPHRIDQA